MWRVFIAATVVVMIECSAVVAATPSQNSRTDPCYTLRKGCFVVRGQVIEALRNRNPVEALHAIDGDTFWARVQISNGSYINFKVRLRRIDAPEMKARCIKEREWALDALEELESILDAGDIEFHEIRRDKYPDRIAASVSTILTPDVSTAMLDSGLARSYSGGRRETWCP